MVLCDFLGRARALKAIYSWYISPKHALAMNRHILVSHFGHLVSLVWAKLILGRFRDAVLPDFSRFPDASDDYLNAFFTDPRHGRYCGRTLGEVSNWVFLSQEEKDSVWKRIRADGTAMRFQRQAKEGN